LSVVYVEVLDELLGCYWIGQPGWSKNGLGEGEPRELISSEISCCVRCFCLWNVPDGWCSYRSAVLYQTFVNFGQLSCSGRGRQRIPFGHVCLFII